MATTLPGTYFPSAGTHAGVAACGQVGGGPYAASNSRYATNCVTVTSAISAAAASAKPAEKWTALQSIFAICVASDRPTYQRTRAKRSHLRTVRTARNRQAEFGV